MKGITFGFDIVLPENLSKVNPVMCKNYSSATGSSVKLQVEKQLLSEIKLGHYMVTETRPLIVSALGAIPKPDSKE